MQTCGCGGAGQYSKLYVSDWEKGSSECEFSGRNSWMMIGCRQRDSKLMRKIKEGFA